MNLLLPLLLISTAVTWTGARKSNFPLIGDSIERKQSRIPGERKNRYIFHVSWCICLHIMFTYIVYVSLVTFSDTGRIYINSSSRSSESGVRLYIATHKTDIHFF